VDVHPLFARNPTCMDEIMMDERDIGLEKIPPPPAPLPRAHPPAQLPTSSVSI